MNKEELLNKVSDVISELGEKSPVLLVAEALDILRWVIEGMPDASDIDFIKSLSKCRQDTQSAVKAVVKAAILRNQSAEPESQSAGPCSSLADSQSAESCLHVIKCWLGYYKYIKDGTKPFEKRGYFGIGIDHGKNVINYGTLFRTAQILGADFIFLINKRFKKQASDTQKLWRHLPVYSYDNFQHFYNNIPYDCQLVGVELNPSSIPIEKFKHPERACYLLGAEDHGLSPTAIKHCHKLIKLKGDTSLNVATAGSIVMYHRTMQEH